MKFSTHNLKLSTIICESITFYQSVTRLPTHSPKFLDPTSEHEHRQRRIDNFFIAHLNRAAACPTLIIGESCSSSGTTGKPARPETTMPHSAFPHSGGRIAAATRWPRELENGFSVGVLGWPKPAAVRFTIHKFLRGMCEGGRRRLERSDRNFDAD